LAKLTQTGETNIPQSDEITALKQHIANLCTIITGAVYSENLEEEQIEQVHAAMDLLPDVFPPREERE
jgi:hypothetical protein